MKLVSFEIDTWLGPVRRIGVLIDGQQDGRIADLTSAYVNYLKRETDEPTPGRTCAIAHAAGYDRLAARRPQVARGGGAGGFLYSTTFGDGFKSVGSKRRAAGFRAF